MTGKKKTLLVSVIVSAVFTGCGSWGLVGDGSSASNTSCEKFLNMDAEAQQQVAARSLEAEGRAVTPALVDTYRDALDLKCYTSAGDEPIGDVNAWRMPVPENLSLPDFSTLRHDAIMETFPNADDWSRLGFGSSTNQDATYIDRWDDSMIEWVNDSKEAGETCQHSLGFRVWLMNPELVDATKFIVRSSSRLDSDQTIWAEILNMSHEQAQQDWRQGFVDQVEGSFSDECARESNERGTQFDATGVGIPEAQGVMTARFNQDGVLVAHHLLVAPFGPNQILVLGFPMNTAELTSPEQLADAPEQLHRMDEDFEATARWIYRKLANEPALPAPGDRYDIPPSAGQ